MQTASIILDTTLRRFDVERDEECQTYVHTLNADLKGLPLALYYTELRGSGQFRYGI